MTEEDRPLFSPDDFPEFARGTFTQPSVKPLPFPIWTENKARLIARYLYYFVLITKHGTYIDAFAGAQNQFPDMWAAKRVIESQPRWLRHVHLIELDPAKIASLEALKSADEQTPGPTRQIHVHHGDCNTILPRILSDGSIGAKEATFCLLDQRTFECEWSTIRSLAQYKPDGEHKIELFYFLPIAWLDRSLAATTKNIDNLERWWGRPDWQTLRGLSGKQRAERFVERFQREFGYASVLPWPIYEGQGSNKLMYYMVHASDHPEAPKLMRRAYIKAVEPLETFEQLRLDWQAGAFDDDEEKSAR